MLRGEPYSRGGTIAALAAVFAAAACGGGTSVESVSGPGAVRCQTTATTDTAAVGADGGRVTITIDAERECTWTASSDAPWLQLGATSGQGAGSVVADAAANQQSIPRTATVQVNNARVVISQEGRPCRYELAETTAQFGHQGGRGSISMTTLHGCVWRASTNAPWVRLLTDSRTGPGSIEFDVAPNGGPARETAITVADQTFRIVQGEFTTAPALPGPGCSATVTPVAIDAPAAGSTATITLTIASTCEWTAASDRPWIAITSVHSGRGNAAIAIAVAANAGGSRSGTLTVADRQIPVAQAGTGPAPSCTYSLNPLSQSVAASGGDGRISVTTQPACSWAATTTASWVTITAGSGTGTGEVLYAVQQNGATAARSATVTVAGQTHTVTQAAALSSCTYNLSPPSRNVSASGGQSQFNVITQNGCGWTATSSVSWVVITTGSGSGNGAVVYTFEANSATSSRSGTINVGGQSHAVTQAAATPTCTFSLDPASQAIGDGGGSGQFNVATQNGCSWTAATTASWISVTSGSGSGAGAVSYMVQANTATDPRSAVITVGGQTHTVAQAAAPVQCTYSLDPAARDISASGGEQRFSVNTQAGCAWSASGGDSWLAVTSGSGSGPGEVVYSVQENTTPEPRSATITVAGQSHSVTQAGSSSGPSP